MERPSGYAKKDRARSVAAARSFSPDVADSRTKLSSSSSTRGLLGKRVSVDSAWTLEGILDAEGYFLHESDTEAVKLAAALNTGSFVWNSEVEMVEEVGSLVGRRGPEIDRTEESRVALDLRGFAPDATEGKTQPVWSNPTIPHEKLEAIAKEKSFWRSLSLLWPQLPPRARRSNLLWRFLSKWWNCVR